MGAPGSSVDDGLARLADACGVAVSYVDQAGVTVHVPRDTIEAVLRALDVDLDIGVDAALERIELRDWRRMLPPVFIGREGEERRLWVHVPDGDPVAVRVRLEDGSAVTLAQLDRWVEPREIDGVRTGEASFAVPGDLPLGYHEVEAESPTLRSTMPLVMTPRRLAPEAIGDRQWGFMTQLYATRSAQSWGLGDLHDGRVLAEWSASSLGAGFLLVNPLHAASPVPPMTPSPYLPVTRRFANPIYLRIEDISEYALLAPAVRERIEELANELRLRNRTDDLLDRDAVWAAKRVALETIAQVPRSPERESAFTAFCRREGDGLRDFATWCAISDALGPDGGWPDDLRHPQAPAVQRFRDAHSAEVEFHMWLQWQLDEQLAAMQAGARDAGMAIGVMHDLAVGVHPEGADAWALQDVLARGVSVGAPPDMYNQMGQDWSQPPWRPDTLAEAGFVPYRDMLRTVLRHCGGLRIDHVLGLFRLWWVPQGMPASAGTFVRFDFDAMLGILCLEAQRAGAMVVGEDLGTVEPWVADVLADRGILGTVILWFEADAGRIRHPASWRRDVLASVTVHDLPPTAGYLRQEHVRIRAELDLLTTPVDVERAKAIAERDGWAALLRESGWLAADVDPDTDEGVAAMTVALHRAAASSPARLLGIGLGDVVGDRRAQNQPGTDQEYPNWRVPLTDGSGRPMLIEDLPEQAGLLAPIMNALGPEVGRTP